MRCWRARFPGVRLVNFGHLGDGNLHYNVQAPAGGDAGGLPARARGARSTRWSTTRSTTFGGSISAEHGIGALKGDELAEAQVAGGAGDDARDQARRWIRRAC